MNWKLTVGPLCVAFALLAMGGLQTAYAYPPANACSLLTPAEVSAVLGMAVGTGTPFPTNSKLCQWGTVSLDGRAGKGVTLNLQDVAAFAYAKMPLGHGITKVPVSGIGDDAVYGTTPGWPTVLTVKKGQVVFTLHVSGFPDEQLKTKEKTLALNVLAKL